MAQRGLSSVVLIEIAKSQMRLAYLVEFYFSTGTNRYTDAGRDLVWGGNSYESNGNFLTVDKISESLTPTIQTIQIQLSGVPQANIAELLTAQHVDRRLVVRRAFLDPVWDVLPDPVIMFDGRLNGWSLREDVEGGTASIAWTANNHWGGDWSRVAGRRANHKDQQTYFATDMFYDRMGVQNGQTLKWGSV